jgi:hypothetical protein
MKNSESLLFSIFRAKTPIILRKIEKRRDSSYAGDE